MAREFKFRIWEKPLKEFHNFNMKKDSLIQPVLGLEAHNMVIEQYTGLKDKNGKEIYEGDIVKYDGILYEVVWDDEYFGFDVKRNEMDFLFNARPIMTCGSVIGNIHENSELLGEGDK